MGVWIPASIQPSSKRFAHKTGLIGEAQSGPSRAMGGHKGGRGKWLRK